MLPSSFRVSKPFGLSCPVSDVAHGETVMILEPGLKAPSSGIFKVIHAKNHTPTHYVTALYGETLPRCHQCLAGVRFELVIRAVHVKAHSLFDAYKHPG